MLEGTGKNRRIKAAFLAGCNEGGDGRRGLLRVPCAFLATIHSAPGRVGGLVPGLLGAALGFVVDLLRSVIDAAPGVFDGVFRFVPRFPAYRALRRRPGLGRRVGRKPVRTSERLRGITPIAAVLLSYTEDCSFGCGVGCAIEATGRGFRGAGRDPGPQVLAFGHEPPTESPPTLEFFRSSVALASYNR